MAAHQAPPSLRFSRQGHWSGLPFPSPVQESEKWIAVPQSCLPHRNPMDCSLPGSSIHGIFQARVLEWDAIAFFDGAEQKAEPRSGIKQDRATEPTRWEASLTELWFVVPTFSVDLLKEGTTEEYGGLVVKTPNFQCRNTDSIPGWGTQIPHPAKHGQNK